MKYTHKSFSVAVSDVVSGGSQMCREKGHSMRDSRGRCLCCGEKTGVVEIAPNVFTGPPLTPWQRQFVTPKEATSE